MAFLARFSYDVFVCYATADDETLPGAEEGWVKGLLRGLQLKLDQRLTGKNVCTFRVHGDPPDDPLVEMRILEELDASAVVIVMASPAYVASRWCHPKGKKLQDSLRHRIKGGEHVFLVEYNKIDESDRPMEFSQLRPHRFWLQETPGEPPYVLGVPKPSPDDPRYYDVLTDLSLKIDAELRLLKAAEQTSPSVQIPGGAGVGSLGKAAASGGFDVFLCHNSADKPSVKRIGERLKAFGLRPWLDDWQLRPGFPWQRLLEEQISTIASAAVFVGANGIGPWQQDEIDAFLRKFHQRRCPVIPVLLPEAPQVPVLPIFLEGMTWVDFRNADSDPMGKLYWGITGKQMAETRPVVFLAEATEDLEDERASVGRYLEQCGISVLPKALYPQSAPEFQSYLERDLAQCSLFVQLLSALPGRKLEGSAKTYVSFQYEWAANKKMKMLQWRSRDLDVATVSNPDHRKLLEKDTVVAVTLEEYKSLIREEAFRTPSKPAKRPVNAFVFVNWESDDADLGDQVRGVLKRLGADIALPPNKGTPQEVRKSLEKNLSECDGVIIVYGRTTADWVGEQLRQCRKIVADRGPSRPLKAVGVYEGPPEPKVPLDIDLHNMQVLNCHAGVSENEIEAFLEAVQPEGNP